MVGTILVWYIRIIIGNSVEATNSESFKLHPKVTKSWPLPFECKEGVIVQDIGAVEVKMLRLAMKVLFRVMCWTKREDCIEGMVVQDMGLCILN